MQFLLNIVQGKCNVNFFLECVVSMCKCLDFDSFIMSREHTISRSHTP